jgi:hypothetical protein
MAGRQLTAISSVAAGIHRRPHTGGTSRSTAKRSALDTLRQACEQQHCWLHHVCHLGPHSDPLGLGLDPTPLGLDRRATIT